MSLRFRRRIRIAPGLTLNLAKRGVSVSAGIRGAHVTAGRGALRETVGLPGTGLSATHVERRRRPSPLHHVAGLVVGLLAIAWLCGWL